VHVFLQLARIAPVALVDFALQISSIVTEMTFGGVYFLAESFGEMQHYA